MVLGKARMPLHQLLRLGRGAIVALEASEADEVEILANGLPVARGAVVVTGEPIAVEVTAMIGRETVIRDRGARLDGGASGEADALPAAA